MDFKRFKRNILIELRKYQDDIDWALLGIKSKNATSKVIKIMQKYDPAFEGIGYFACRRFLLNEAHLSADCLYAYILDLKDYIHIAKGL